MSKESYARGFCKAAHTAGVDPVALAKYAQEGVGGVGPTRVNAVDHALMGIKNDPTFDYDTKGANALANAQWVPQYLPNAIRHPLAVDEAWRHVNLLYPEKSATPFWAKRFLDNVTGLLGSRFSAKDKNNYVSALLDKSTRKTK